MGWLNCEGRIMPRDLQSTLNSVDDVDIQNSEGDTALHYATRNGRLEIAEYLLSGGADHTIQNNKKETPLDCLLKKHEPQELLDLAIQKGFLKLAELSIDAGADVNLINRDEKFTSPLSEAVENNNLAVVQLLVGRRANIRFTASKDSNMVNMLHLATSNCNLEMMKFFIEKGLDVNETDFYDDTTLHTVIKSSTNKKDKLASVELLLANGADISAIGDERKTPLQLAEEKGYADIVDILRNKIKLQKEKKLFAAAEKGDFECVKKAIELDTNINIQDKYGYTPLFVAADNGYENIVKLLIEKGADVNLRANNSYTPLLIAASKGYENIIKLLTDKKEIDVNAKTNSGDTSLFLAATYGYENIVKLLINKGANVNVEVNSQWARWTPLLFVIHKGYKNIAKLLIKGEACINAQDEDGKTPLHYAAQNGRLEIVKLLLENGADVNAKNKYGEAILHFVIVEGNLEIAKLLLEHGANINYQGSYNDTALHEAIKNRHRDITEYLINIEDINLNLQNKEGKTPLHLAVLYGYSEIVRLLVEKKSSLDIQDKFGQTALHIAIQKNHLKSVKLLLENGANVNAKDDSCRPPLPERHGKDDISIHLGRIKVEEDDVSSRFSGIRVEECGKSVTQQNKI